MHFFAAGLPIFLFGGFCFLFPFFFCTADTEAVNFSVRGFLFSLFLLYCRYGGKGGLLGIEVCRDYRGFAAACLLKIGWRKGSLNRFG
jgi:hypothetical protein